MKCVEVVGVIDEKAKVPRYSAGCVRRTLLELLAEDVSAP